MEIENLRYVIFRKIQTIKAKRDYYSIYRIIFLWNIIDRIF